MLPDRILTYITNCNGLVSLDKLVTVANSAGFSELEVLDALFKLDKKLKSTARGGVVYYQVAPEKPAPTVGSHITWASRNYPINDLGICPFKICGCSFRKHWQPAFGHFKDCDSIIYPDEYKEQNPWDSTAGILIDKEAYEKECAKQKAVRERYTKSYMSVPTH